LRRQHFEELRPICPRCALDGRGQNELQISAVYSQSGDIIVSGIIRCPERACRMSYPVLDGVPVIVPNVAEYIANSQAQIMRREPLHDDLQGLLGDAIGPGTEFDQTRQYLSIYCWGHYADLDPAEQPKQARSAVSTLLDDCAVAALGLSGPAIDLGCSVGRSSFELAAYTRGLVLGVDLNFAMLRLGQAVLMRKQLNYERRRIGIVFDRREFPVELPSADSVDFWACDVLALPFRGGAFGSALALNVLDCVTAPRDMLAVLRALLVEGGVALVCTPFDWTPGATPVGNWIGGHSQSGRDKGAAEPMMEELLSVASNANSVAGFAITDTISAARWVTRLHDRSTVHYQVYAMALRAVV
jgi:SAM-dependent methyltransferase/uncharacterized protein YbaR (Trm112 family)